ncbi:signal peptide peptidase SppA [Flammeovirgaceae bacterium SG7u.111]|nr:signal peptide peptidase SppA [Flammeovirgaceae bacterium SG7u.132]WPO34596.1 signal peptide peptidase SppA [Flammeovirgaceae bacterium SG7u.111]
MKFIRNVIATLVALMLFFGFFFVILIGIASMSGGDEVAVKSNSILTLKLNKPIKEQGQEDPFSELNIPFAPELPMGLDQIKQSIAKAAMDDRIEGIYLDLSTVGAGFSSLEEIRKSLVAFQDSGKFVVAYGEYFSEGAYFLAAAANEAYLHPLGAIELNGLSAELTFYKGLFDKIGVKPEIFRVGKYKSAVEPYIRKEMSEENRQQISAYINGLYDFYLARVSENREIPLEKLTEISDQSLVREAEDAKELGLIESLAYHDEVMDILRNKLGLESDDKINFIGLGKYSKAGVKGASKYNKNKIAVLVAEGEMQMGKSTDGVMGAETIVSEIRKVRKDDNVKAVVFRINSPGGSALAADLIWRELMLLKEKKPVIASMSDVAASGGFYIAAACDTIMAQPNTITGSIGVFGMFLNPNELMTEKLGITFDVEKTGELSDFGSVGHELTDVERQIIQTSVERTYEIFTQKVADGTGLSQDSVKELASGRVWTGQQAFDRGLIHMLGDFEKSVAIAAEKAELEAGDFQLKYFPQKKDFLTELLEGMSTQMKQSQLESELGELYPVLKEMKKLKAQNGKVQVLMPFEPYSLR